jgi:hypothetical protein
MGTTERFLETAFLEDNSVGACLEARARTRWSFLPARRSASSWNGEGERRLLGCKDELGERFRFPREAAAEARAPKDISAKGFCGFVDSKDWSHF